MFGLVDTSHHPARAHVQVVDRRDANTSSLSSGPGTIIHSDQWAAYAQTAATIPHTAQLITHWNVLTIQQGHTQHVESYGGE